MGNIMNYYWNQTTSVVHSEDQISLPSPQPLSTIVVVQPLPDTREFLTQAQDNIDVSPLIFSEPKLETVTEISSIHNPETPIELCLVNNFDSLKLNKADVEYITSKNRSHIDPHYVTMMRSRPIQRNKSLPSTKSKRLNPI